MNVHSKYRGPRQFLFALHVHVPYYYVRHIVHAQLFDPVPPIANDIKLTTDERIYNCQEKLAARSHSGKSARWVYISRRKEGSEPPARPQESLRLRRGVRETNARTISGKSGNGRLRVVVTKGAKTQNPM